MRLQLIAAFVLAACLALPLSPQVATGNIRGTISDQTGGVVPKCSVTITNTQTGAQRSVITNGRGDFNIPSIPIGVYTIMAEAPGFQRKTLTGIELRVDQTAAFQVVLSPGAVTESVEVRAAAPLLESQTSSLGQVVEERNILDMPLNGRNPFALGALSGGAVPMTGLTTNLPIVAGGGRFSANDILLDGVDDNIRNFNGSVGRAGMTYTPSVDAVEEFKVKTNNFSAEYGHSAGYVMNAAIKAGTNQYHGHLWEFLRNDKLDANNFISNFAGKPKAEFRQNQFGATLGGPVRLPRFNGHDRTFFFVDYEGTQIRQAAGSTLLNLPPASFRSGDFSSSSNIVFDPATRQLAANGVVTAVPFAGNVIPANRQDPTALKIQSLIPGANTGAPNAQGNNYLAVSPRQTHRNQGDLRGDHKVTDRNSLMARISVSRQDVPSQGNFLYSPLEQLFNTVNAVLSDTHVFGPALINEARFGFNRANSSNVATQQTQAMSFAAQNGLQSGPIIGFPTINWANSAGSLASNEFTAFGAATTNFFFENSFEWTDSVTVIRGSHTIKTGADLRRFRFDRLQGFPPSASLFFEPTFTANPSVAGVTGLPYADFLLGMPSQITNSTSEQQWSMQRDLYFGPYVQDDWKIGRRLTLNLGFRYDWFTQPVQARDIGGVFDPYAVSRSGHLGFVALPGKDGFTRAIVRGFHHNFAPRFGFAYQASPRFVVRGGWGIFFGQREQNDQTTDFGINLNNQYAINMPAVNPQTALVPLYGFKSPLNVVSALDPQFTGYTAANPFTGDNRSLDAADVFNAKFPMLQQFNLSLQYELISHLLVEASYSGARGVHWNQRLDVNQEPFQYALDGVNTQANRPFAFINSAIGIDTANVSSWYNAFILRVEHRFSNGFQLLANYTIAHAVDSGNAGLSTFNNQGNTRAMNPYNLQLERGLSPLDIPRRLTVSADYELPVGKGKALSSRYGWVNQVMGGWQMNGILSAQSGLPTDVLVSQLPPVFADSNRPNVVLGQSTLVAHPTFNQFFNPAAFAIPPKVINARGALVQTYGNASRMVLRGPGFANLDYSLFKDIRITEKRMVQFRAEAFNLTNTPAFQLPSARSAQLTVGNPQFGQLAGSQTVGRQLQFGLKLIW
jgi:hypothetical protein